VRGVASLSSPIHVRCHPFFVFVIPVFDTNVTFPRVLVGARRGILFRINIFLVRVVIGKPIFSIRVFIALIFSLRLRVRFIWAAK